MAIASQTEELVDGYGRLHDNLRISVTDRCNIRCFYCMPEDAVEFVPRSGILSFEEIDHFVRVAAGLGIRKLRITGGEPLLRKNLPVLIEKLAAIPGIEDIALTTNGVTLAEQARPLFDAGLRRINVHLDTLDRARFQQITRRDDFDKVMAGIHECLRLGYDPIKINAVAIRITASDKPINATWLKRLVRPVALSSGAVFGATCSRQPYKVVGKRRPTT